MFCPNCGNKLGNGIKFCGVCGTPVPKDIQAPAKPVSPVYENENGKEDIKAPATPKFCPNCGTKTAEGIKFCGTCGERLIAEDTAQNVEDKTSQAVEEVKEAHAGAVNNAAVSAADNVTTETLPSEKHENDIHAETENKNDETDSLCCPYCGTKLPEGAKFCGVCGASLISEQTLEAAAEEAANHAEETKEEQPETVNDTAAQTVMSAESQSAKEIASENAGPLFCPHCGNKLSEGAKFCGVCGNTVAAVPPTPEFETKEASFHAPIVSGEGSFGTVEVNGGAQESRGLGQVIGDAFKSLISSATAIFKNPIKLLPALILAGLWLIINILQGFGINILPVKVFSFLTFAEAGMHGGILGALGGIIGKGMFAGAVVSLIGLFTRKNEAKRSFGDILKGAFGVSAGSMFAYITGIGIAMLLYLFISGGATRVSFMGGVAAAFLVAKAALNNGFLKRLLGSFVPKGSKGASEGINGVIRGLSVGFAASAIIGLTGINLILIILGSLLVIAGGILWILQATGAIKIGSGVNVQ